MTIKTPLPWAVAGAFAFMGLFWHQYMGANVLLFHLFAFAGLRYMYAEAFSSRVVRISMVGSALMAVMVVVHGSLVAKIAYCISFAVWLGFIKAPEMRLLLLIAPQVLGSLFCDIAVFWESRTQLSLHVASSRSILRWGKLTVVPLIALTIFFFIYRVANPKFMDLSDTWLEGVVDVQLWLSQYMSLDWSFHFTLGLLICVWIFMRQRIEQLVKYEMRLPEVLVRRKEKLPITDDLSTISRSPIALKNELRTGLMLIGAVNLLLFVVNAVDIHWLWLTFEYQQGMNLSQMVHEGTYLLILSIMLSMGIMSWYFRANINFYIQKNSLQKLTYLWITQNVLLAIHVLVRNSYYIHYHGLTEKRIGVLIFLALVIFGLLAMTLKVQRKKTLFYLLKVNSWAAYAALLFLGSISWDQVIAQHNIDHFENKSISGEHLLTLSAKTLPTLYSQPRLSQEYSTQLSQKKDTFVQDYEARSWQSWNYADWHAYHQLTK